MSKQEPVFELAKNVEHYLAALSKLYAQEGERQKQEILVNAKLRVHEGWNYDNWNGGTYGHALYLALPEFLYLRTIRQKSDLQNQIREDISRLHNVQNESIDEVFIEMEAAESSDWRKESGLLLTGERPVTPEAEQRIWQNGNFHVFLSHKAEVKTDAAKLKEGLQKHGISCFVAHQDIHPTEEWQSEIENALNSMHALVALMTEEFHDSLWTDQEVGFAFGRGVPIISVRLGRDPYGFIGKFQALSCGWDTAPKEITKLLIKHERMLEAYITAVENCSSFEHGNLLAEILPSITKLSEHQVSRLIEAFNENSEANGSFGLTGSKPFTYGLGLAHHLSRLTDRTYVLSNRKIMAQS